MAIDEQAYHEQFDAVASGALAELLAIAKTDTVSAQVRVDAAKAILHLHLAYHAGAELEEAEAEIGG